MELEKCLTIPEAATRLRIGELKIRQMIKRGILQAIDIGAGVGRQQLRITPEALTQLEQRLAVRPAAPQRRRRRIRDGISDTVRAALGGDEE